MLTAVREYNGVAYSGYPIPITLPGYSAEVEIMESTSSGKRQSMNDCTHYRCSRRFPGAWTDGWHAWYSTTNHARPNPGLWLIGPLPLYELWDTNRYRPWPISASFGSWTDPLKDLPALAVADLSEGTAMLFPDTEKSDNILAQKALEAMLPGIKASLSIPNSIYELKDMRKIPQSMQRIHQLLDASKRLVRRENSALSSLASLRKLGLTAAYKGKTLRQILRSVSDSYLQVSFNLNPLLSDLTALRNSMSGLRGELEALLQRANLPQRRHFRTTLYDEYPSTSLQKSFALSAQTYYTPSLKVTREVNYSVRTFNATLEYSYKLPQVNADLRSVLAILDRLGVNLNPAIIWNALPWSFVVDWVFGVSRWLDQFKVRNIEPIVHVRGFCMSRHVRRTTKVYFDAAPGFVGPVSEVYEDAYRRKAGLRHDQISSSIRSSGLNLKEFSLSSALLLSR